jgi:O-antigen/teichoic acid export membrane protein
MPASRFLAVIVFAALGLSLFSVSSAMIVAAGYPKRTLLSIFPALVILLICMPILTARYGALGAAVLTTASTWFGAGANTLMAARIWGIGVSFRTIVVSLLVSITVYFFSFAWETPGFFVVVKFIILGFLAVLLYWASGETGLKPIRFIQKTPGASPSNEIT